MPFQSAEMKMFNTDISLKTCFFFSFWQNIWKHIIIWLQLITLLLWYIQLELWLTLIPKASHSRVYFGEGILYKHSVLYAVQTWLICDLCYWGIWINSNFPCKTPKWVPEAGGRQSRSWREGGHRCIEMIAGSSTQTIFLIWHTRYITLLRGPVKDWMHLVFSIFDIFS